MTTTPPPKEPAYEINQILILNSSVDLRSAAGHQFANGKRVKILWVKDKNTTGVTTALTAENAQYKVGIPEMQEVDVALGETISSAKVHHAKLSRMRGGQPSSTLFTANQHAYLSEPFTFPHKGKSVTLARGTKVLIVIAGTRTGGTAFQTKDAWYAIAEVKTEKKQVVVQAKIYIDHRDLKLP